MPEQNPSEVPSWLVEEWARQLTHVLEAMIGEAPYVTFAPHALAPAEIDPGQTDFLWWEQPFSIGPDVIAWAGAGTASWEEIGNRILRGAGVEDGDRESVRSTYLEIVNQVCSGVAGALSMRAGKEVSCPKGRLSPPTVVDSTPSCSFEISFGQSVLPIFAVFSAALSNLREPSAQAGATEAAQKKPVSPTSQERGKPSSIELLLDVELPVSVSFGRAQLLLKDVIKLTTGSIVELNRAVSEPVDVIVNNCVIARGDVVVVEGNFGIRIRQVISRQERLRTLY